ncbi:hypothetical protein PVMG_06099 [Plasmodium vivax Mauritania I]|uniref:Variable surface protein Vir35 n=2 Tax=Plasmodium vivax TaxID=5855 RepID=A0A0J9TLS9_PLAVI|nr:hypothetical protein PVBG_05621 [Plasmodium vivax Brazil I]KMZ95697.1 hypothetical protein PVMG_06099 [Plasmodium vivax Mauritania I]
MFGKNNCTKKGFIKINHFYFCFYNINIKENIHKIIINNYIFCNHLEYLYNVENKSVIGFRRSLAKEVYKKEVDRSRIRNQLLDNSTYNDVKGTSDDLSKYSQLKKKGLNDLELYNKLYKHRYSKKNVLGKFDCYCEKKIFNQFDYMLNLSKKINMNKKRLKSFFFKRYGSVLIIVSLVLLLGVIFPALHYGGDKAILKICGSGCQKHDTGKDHAIGYHLSSLTQNTLENIFDAYKVLMFVLPLIFLMFIIYILIKVIKYEKIKSGKSRMSIKEYCRLCKNALA